MARLLLALCGTALIALGCYWLWFEPTAAGKTVATHLDQAALRLHAGEDRIPVSVQTLPAFKRVYRTRLIRPGYAPCVPDAAPVLQLDDASLGCRARIDAPLERGGWAIEQTVTDNLGNAEVCVNVLLFPIAGTAARIWYATSPGQVSTARACNAPVRARFPIAVPNTALRVRPLPLEDEDHYALASRAWDIEDRSGLLTRASDLAYNQLWRDQSLDALAQALEALGTKGTADQPVRVLVAGRELGLPAAASMLLVETPQGLLGVRLRTTDPAPAAPWIGVVDVPGMFETRLVAGMSGERPLLGVLDLGEVAALDADLAETAWFGMGLGATLLLLAIVLHALVRLRAGMVGKRR